MAENSKVDSSIGNMHWPATIKLIRDTAGLSRERLARYLDVSLSTVYNWEAGVVEPSPLARRQLARRAGQWYRQGRLDEALWQLLKGSMEGRLARRVKTEEARSMGNNDGRLLSASYSFSPNRLGYCGPDENKEMLDYLVEGTGDPGLASILERFEGMYPYLKFIAEANGIPDPFDRRVVEAYWIGNGLLERASLVDFYRALKERFSKRMGEKAIQHFIGNVPLGARSHHSFHVLSVPIRPGHIEIAHTLETMDECRVSWGRVKAVDNPYLTVEHKPLGLEGDTIGTGAVPFDGV